MKLGLFCSLCGSKHFACVLFAHSLNIFPQLITHNEAFLQQWFQFLDRGGGGGITNVLSTGLIMLPANTIGIQYWLRA